jgi:hypothetical protein
MRGTIRLPLVLSSLSRTASSQNHSPPKPAFRFSHEAGRTLTTLWQTSVAARQERVACLASTIRHDTVFVSRVLPIEAEGAGSDRGVMRRWYQRWHSDGVLCLLYSARDAHSEADGW